MPAPASRHVPWLRRKTWAALQLPRMDVRRNRALPRAAIRRYRVPRRAVQRQGSNPIVPGPNPRWVNLGVSRTATGAAASRLGAVQLEERLPPDRVRRCSLQLVSVPGEFDRSCPLRMDAPELERPPAR